jgi:hypothetical protein
MLKSCFALDSPSKAVTMSVAFGGITFYPLVRGAFGFVQLCKELGMMRELLLKGGSYI